MTSECLMDQYAQKPIVFAHADVTPTIGPPYWITASRLWVAYMEFNAHESDIAVCSSLLNLKLDV